MLMLAMVGVHPRGGDAATDGAFVAIVVAVMAILGGGALVRLYGWRFWRWPGRDFLRWW
jgi:hypothetical protein